MVESSERILRQSLDEVDRLRTRSITTFLITAVFIAQAAWFALAGVNRLDVKQAMVVATFALAMCVFGGVFMLVGHITRMTRRILQAIELISKG